MKVRFRWGPRGSQGGRGWVLGKGGRSQEGEGLRLGESHLQRNIKLIL